MAPFFLFKFCLKTQFWRVPPTFGNHFVATRCTTHNYRSIIVCFEAMFTSLATPSFTYVTLRNPINRRQSDYVIPVSEPTNIIHGCDLIRKPLRRAPPPPHGYEKFIRTALSMFIRYPEICIVYGSIDLLCYSFEDSWLIHAHWSVDPCC